MSELPEIDWEQRLRDAVAETLRLRDARRTERAAFKARRNVGLERRYAAKAARQDAGSVGLQGNWSPGDESRVSPCCAGTEDGVCPQHEQAARETGHAGPRSRSGGGSRVIGESGKAKPVRRTETDR